jgi:hypothetical protein
MCVRVCMRERERERERERMYATPQQQHDLLRPSLQPLRQPAAPPPPAVNVSFKTILLGTMNY